MVLRFFPQKGAKHPSYTTAMVTFLLLSLQCPCETKKPALGSRKKVTALASFLVLLYLEHQKNTAITQLKCRKRNAGVLSRLSLATF